MVNMWPLRPGDVGNSGGMTYGVEVLRGGVEYSGGM